MISLIFGNSSSNRARFFWSALPSDGSCHSHVNQSSSFALISTSANVCGADDELMTPISLSASLDFATASFHPGISAGIGAGPSPVHSSHFSPSFGAICLY